MSLNLPCKVAHEVMRPQGGLKCKATSVALAGYAVLFYLEMEKITNTVISLSYNGSVIHFET